jgi:isopentenyl-diphosphate delta-isomerase
MPDLRERKGEHLDLAKMPSAMAQVENSLDRVRLTHQALPEIDADDVDTSTKFLNYRLAMPLMISGMTGGMPRGDAINLALAEMASQHGIAICIGSQRASLMVKQSQSELRARAKGVPLIGNLGGVQLAGEGGLALAQRAIDDIGADAIAIHLNPLQELAQPEGDRDWRGVLATLGELVKKSEVPIMVKEVGAGISAKTARQLMDQGVRIIDVAGLGGTNWTRIEQSRSDPLRQDVMAPFLDWGISTVDALISARAEHKDATIIASGGIRHGLDVARCVWLGSDLVSAAGVFIKVLEDENQTLRPNRLDALLSVWKDQLKIAMFLTASKTLKALKTAEGEVLMQK